MQRRRFLGAAAALAALPVTTSASGSTLVPEDVAVSVEEGPCGTTGTAEVADQSPMWTSFYLGQWDAEETPISVKSYWYGDGEQALVEMNIQPEHMDLGLSMTPDRALELAEDLRRVAELAKRGSEQARTDR